eukprot:CAMPEP_0197910430 /NCGR_PEP_ID=MMETSP1439-20131203/70899_1 /TAXON_ID=66791 /ORGANISM="Gonyaulax spinifera, Strain CCMP409" /LENGTH=75 /DNA_ID=CAMNT_0043532089 /DNA_START=12 /DNA_END=235 /DNA_ORIENTATION=-
MRTLRAAVAYPGTLGVPRRALGPLRDRPRRAGERQRDAIPSYEGRGPITKVAAATTSPTPPQRSGSGGVPGVDSR